MNRLAIDNVKEGIANIQWIDLNSTYCASEVAEYLWLAQVENLAKWKQKGRLEWAFRYKWNQIVEAMMRKWKLLEKE